VVLDLIFFEHLMKTTYLDCVEKQYSTARYLSVDRPFKL
jgi:hypothetical protein